MIYIFIKITALFWTLTEIIILFYLNWAYSFIKGKEKGENIFTISCIALFVSLALLLFLGETKLDNSIDFIKEYNLYYYRIILRDFFYTLWVVLEAIIMIYVLTIYKSVKSLLMDKYTINKDISATGSNFNVLNLFIILSFCIIIFFFVLYISYEFNLFSLVINHQLSLENFQNISQFYMPICGVFWIIFEAGVAFMGFMFYSLLKKSEMNIS